MQNEEEAVSSSSRCYYAKVQHRSAYPGAERERPSGAAVDPASVFVKVSRSALIMVCATAVVR